MMKLWATMPQTSGWCRGLLDHLVEVVDHHLGERARGAVVKGDHRHVVHFMRVRDAQERPAAGAHPCRLVVHRPIERVSETVLGEQILRHGARVRAGAHPAAGRLAFVLGHRLEDLADHRPARPLRRARSGRRSSCGRARRTPSRRRDTRPRAGGSARSTPCSAAPSAGSPWCSSRASRRQPPTRLPYSRHAQLYVFGCGIPGEYDRPRPLSP